ncbi:tRNA lysidine(34) synthetase TilS [Bdellovibrio sp. qaytius]|nr:tRNA lysidine(34) synthetase TilS [Bdellovibrio sp. qaytius]
MSWNDFEHSIWKQLKSESLTDRSEYILAISGGLDSMALVHAMRILKPQAQLIVVHFHHGESDKNEINTFRDQALQIVKSYCETHSLKFKTAQSQQKLTTEAEFREARFEFFSQVQTEFPNAILVTAHHKDDLLETWLLKMIRGTGAEGLENFKFWNKQVLRPLILFTKAEILSYAQAAGVVWVEDPTNKQSDYLRNWLRNEWLRDLSDKIPGSIENLTNSLQRLISEVKVNDEVLVISFESQTKAVFDRTEFLQLSHSDQLKILARALKGIGQREFSQGQLEEIIKRLDKNQKDIIFSVAGVNWFINAQQVMLVLE